MEVMPPMEDSCADVPSLPAAKSSCAAWHLYIVPMPEPKPTIKIATASAGEKRHLPQPRGRVEREPVIPRRGSAPSVSSDFLQPHACRRQKARRRLLHRQPTHLRLKFLFEASSAAHDWCSARMCCSTSCRASSASSLYRYSRCFLVPISQFILTSHSCQLSAFSSQLGSLAISF